MIYKLAVNINRDSCTERKQIADEDVIIKCDRDYVTGGSVASYGR